MMAKGVIAPEKYSARLARASGQNVNAKRTTATTAKGRRAIVPIRATAAPMKEVNGQPPKEASPAAPAPPAPGPTMGKALYDKAAGAGATKASMPFAKVLVLGILGGAYISFGAFLAFAVGGHTPQLAQANPGLQRFLLGAIGLPMGLLMTIITGAELFTANTALVPAAMYEGKAGIGGLLRNWVASYLGNVIGAAAVLGLAAAAGTPAGLPAPANAAAAKTALPFATAVVRGLCCNWLVCMAVMQALSADTFTGKALAILLPVSCFVALGMEHSIANLFMVPYGIICGGSSTMSQFLSANLVPVTIGNTIGGFFFVATLLSFAYGNLGQKLQAA